MKKIRWGIVGPGGIANKFAQAIKNVECAELTAVASRDKDRGDAFAEKYDIPNAFCGYDKMAQSDAVDAVYIATPHPFHKPCAELFLNAKKHVLCEKPICINVSEAQALKACAEKNGVFLMEAMWTRFLPAIKEAQKIVEEGKIGEVMGLEADFCFAATEHDVPRLYLDSLAGGALLDVGVYCLHFASLFLGNNPQSITAYSNNYNGADVHTCMLLKYENGAIANLSSAVGLSKPQNAYVYGTKGHIFIPDFYGASKIIVNSSIGEETIIKECIGNGFEEEIIEACRCILNDKSQSDILPLDESITILKQMDEIRRQIGIKYPFENN